MVDDPTPIRPARPELLIGPFEAYKVVVEGRAIPNMTGFKEGDKTFLILDNRLSIGVPHDLAPTVAWFAANAMAIGQGYTHLGATSKDASPFAPQITEWGGGE